MAEEMLKKSTFKSPFVAEMKQILRLHHLHSVCESAHCPNIGDCFKKRTATFLILGNSCTRNCRFCNIVHNENIPLPRYIDFPKYEHIYVILAPSSPLLPSFPMGNGKSVFYVYESGPVL